MNFREPRAPQRWFPRAWRAFTATGTLRLPCFSAVKDRYFPEPYCAWTAVGVAELLLPAALVEVKATARLR